MASQSKPGYHKLKNVSDWGPVSSHGLKPSRPEWKHWLGEGVYFFLDPNGLHWAVKWPMNKHNLRSGSREGIISAELDLENALDLTDNDIRRAIEKLVTTLKLKLRMEERINPPIYDGSIFAALFRYGMCEDVVPFSPTAILANFDDTYKLSRIADSRVFMEEGTEIMLLVTAQIQACIINPEVIGKLTVVENNIK